MMEISETRALSKPITVISWILQLVVAVILLQTLFFKFAAHPDSVHIFETVGLEPFGRIGSGIAELLAGILILIPATIWIGAILSTGVISGAIFFHVFGGLGIEVNGDGGLLFALAIVVFTFSITVLILRRRAIPLIGAEF